MNNVEKLRIMLQHWMEHNKGHMEEFEKWRETMQNEGQVSLAAHVAKAIEMMAGMNEELHQALHEAGGHHQGNHEYHHHHHNDGGHHHHHHHDGHHHHEDDGHNHEHDDGHHHHHHHR